MRPKTLILFVVAVGCGLVASIGVSQYLESAKGNIVAVDTAKIYVATTEVSAGDKLDAKNVSLEEWPKDRIPEGSVDDLKQFEGKFSRFRMYKGEPILLTRLTELKDGVTESITPGYRVVAVSVDDKSSAGNLIRAGDRVDLILFVRKSADVPETSTRTILSDVNVFAVGGKTERYEDKQGSSREVRNVSLLVTPMQANSVMLAKELGVLSLSLRRPGEKAEDPVGDETVVSLLNRDTESANEKKKKQAQVEPAPAPNIIMTPVAPVAPVVQPMVVVEPPKPPAFTMKIRTNNGDHTFVWSKLDGQPTELEAETPAAAPTRPGVTTSTSVNTAPEAPLTTATTVNSESNWNLPPVDTGPESTPANANANEESSNTTSSNEIPANPTPSNESPSDETPSNEDSGT